MAFATAHRHDIVSSATKAPVYKRRQPEKTVLYEVVRDHLEDFLHEGRRRSEHGFGYPSYVEKTFRKFLSCGMLGAGFARLRCASCGAEHLVAFSCKGRGICPSCQGRRMAETAARLVDTLLPSAFYRQVVFTFPFPMRLRMAKDPKLTSAVLRCCQRALFTQMRKRGRELGIKDGRPAAITAIQQFGGALNLNIHFHLVVADALFVVESEGVRMVPLPHPTDEDIEALLKVVKRNVARLFAKISPDDEDEAACDEEGQTLCFALAEAAQLPRGPSIAEANDPKAQNTRRLCVAGEGFSIHAASFVEPDDRLGLERMLRYILRPAFASDRLSWTHDGRVRYKLKRLWHNGATHIDMEPLAFMRRLALLIPKPRQNLLRYHGLFAPNAKHRHSLAGLLPKNNEEEKGDPKQKEQQHSETANAKPTWQGKNRYRLGWAMLLKRVFSVDVATCSKCQGPMLLLALLTDPKVVTRILDHLGLPSSIPEPRPKTLHQKDFFDDFDQGSGGATPSADVLPANSRAPPSIRWGFQR